MDSNISSNPVRKLAVLLHRLWVSRGVRTAAIARKRCAPWPRGKSSAQKQGMLGSTELDCG